MFLYGDFRGYWSNRSLCYCASRFAKLLADGVLLVTGKGKASRYALSPAYALFQPVDLDGYFSQEIDERQINETYNFDLIESTLAVASLFTKNEIERLDGLHICLPRISRNYLRHNTVRKWNVLGWI